MRAFFSFSLLLAPALASFVPFQHGGGQAPWFPSPSLFGIPSHVPESCVVDQAACLVRHGSRYPETGSFAGWVSLFEKIQNASFTARDSLTFLPSWKLPLDDPNNQATFLSGTGAGEAFALGVDLRKRYALTPGGSNFTVWAASQQRVVDTAQWFLDGYLSLGHYNLTSQSRIVVLPDSVNFTFANSLTPSAACPKYNNDQTLANNYRAALRPPITKRLNKMLTGLVLNDTDIGVMMDLCAYQTEISGFSPFCAVFKDGEWLQFEYSQDLQYYYGAGPGNDLAGTTAFPLIQALSDIFVAGPGNKPAGLSGDFMPPPLMMGFTHDNNLPPLVAALGLLNDSSYAPLNPHKFDPRRKFRSSFIVPFRGTLALERLSCTGHPSPRTVQHVVGKKPTSVPTSQYVRIKINDAVVPIPTCQSGPGFSCPLAQYAKYVKQRGVAMGDFVQKCGLSSVKNATSTLDFLTNPRGPFLT